MITPVPETKRAILIHARTGKPIWHRYLATVPGIVADKMYTDEFGDTHTLKGGAIWEHIFESEDEDPAMRSQRVWGCDDSKSRIEEGERS